MLKTIDDKHLMEAEFYNTPFKFSYSSLNRLLLAPSVFYKEYVLKEKEVRTEKHLLEGKLIHFLLLDGNNFDDHFLLMPEDLPSPNSIKVINAVFETYQELVAENPDATRYELCDFPDKILDVLKEINLHQSLKNDEGRIKKVVDTKSTAYFNYLKVKGSKDIIDSDTLAKCTEAVEIIKENDEICDLLGMNREDDGKTFAVYSEIPLEMDLDKMPFGLKGILDNMTIDTIKKQININDFKTSSKSLNDFPETVEYWKYWLQAVVYIKLAKKFFKDVINDDPSWNITFRFIVYDKYNHLYAYPVSNETLALWFRAYDEVMIAAKYHYVSKDFTLPYDFAVGNVNL